MTLVSDLWQDRGYIIASFAPDGQSISVRQHIRPGMTLLWLSWGIMGLGGLLAALRQRG
jgi:hypothetical protein